MSQVTGPLTINDGLATPVARSFSPVAVSPGLSVFAEKSSAASSGYKKLTISASMADGKRQTNRIDVNLDMPVTETVNGIPTVTRTARFKGYFVIPDACTTAERSDLVAFVANSFDNSQLRAVIKDLDPLY